MAKESDVSKTEVEGNEEILDESTTAPQTSIAEPTAVGDHSTTTTAMKPPPTKPKKTKTKSKKPTETTKTGPLEDEIPEDLIERISNLETIVADMKDQLKQLVDAFKSRPSHQQLCQELWNSIQPILTAQRELAEIQLNSHMKLIRVMVEARYKDTHADIKGIKECIAKLTGTTPAPVFEKDNEDDAEKREKDSMKNFGKPTPRNQPKLNLKPAKQTSSKSSGKSDTSKKKGINDTLNKQTDKEIERKKKRKDTKEEDEVLNIGTSNRRKSHKHNKSPIVIFPKPISPPEKPTTAAKLKTTAEPKKPDFDTPKPKLSPEKTTCQKAEYKILITTTNLH
ncbi:actin-binding protein-like [Helianthus annuus]|uniref:actin-binding protein-like n=1 Tax=Helianthus annuus TaxID=4232 RepID=UPI001652C3D9|nr:actin-binding protein-like [Helianthus annuus]